MSEAILGRDSGVASRLIRADRLGEVEIDRAAESFIEPADGLLSPSPRPGDRGIVGGLLGLCGLCGLRGLRGLRAIVPSWSEAPDASEAEARIELREPRRGFSAPDPNDRGPKASCPYVGGTLSWLPKDGLRFSEGRGEEERMGIGRDGVGEGIVGDGLSFWDDRSDWIASLQRRSSLTYRVGPVHASQLGLLFHL